MEHGKRPVQVLKAAQGYKAYEEMLIYYAMGELLKENADYVCLIKPQFEAGREQVGKKGVVRDPAVHCQVITSVLDSARSFGYSVQGLDFSPITGQKGNIEFLAEIRKSDGKMVGITQKQIQMLVAEAHDQIG